MSAAQAVRAYATTPGQFYVGDSRNSRRRRVHAGVRRRVEEEGLRTGRQELDVFARSRAGTLTVPLSRSREERLHSPPGGESEPKRETEPNRARHDRTTDQRLSQRPLRSSRHLIYLIAFFTSTSGQRFLLWLFFFSIFIRRTLAAQPRRSHCEDTGRVERGKTGWVHGSRGCEYSRTHRSTIF